MKASKCPLAAAVLDTHSEHNISLRPDAKLVRFSSCLHHFNLSEK